VKAKISIFTKPVYIFALVLVQVNPSEEEIRELNYKIFEENKPQIQNFAYTGNRDWKH
jgi:hypothetical protein